MHLQAALGPIGQSMVGMVGRRVHRSAMDFIMEHSKNVAVLGVEATVSCTGNHLYRASDRNGAAASTF